MSYYKCPNGYREKESVFIQKNQFFHILLEKETFNMDLQTKVSKYLSENGIKKKYLASLLGIYPTQLSLWLSGRYTLTNIQIKRVENFLSGKLNKSIT